MLLHCVTFFLFVYSVHAGPFSPFVPLHDLFPAPGLIPSRLSRAVGTIASVQNYTSVTVTKPSHTAYVVQALLLVAYNSTTDLPINFLNSNLSGFASGEANASSFRLKWTLVTPLVRQLINPRGMGGHSFPVVETNSILTNGITLEVIFLDPTLPPGTSRSVASWGGIADMDGSNLYFDLGSNLDFTSPDAVFEMGVGIGFSSTIAQLVQIDVQGQRLTSSAGGTDDIQSPETPALGNLATCGGEADSTANPADPFFGGLTSDDELYNLLPFFSNYTGTSLILNLTVIPGLQNDVMSFNYAHFYYSSTLPSPAQEQLVVATPMPVNAIANTTVNFRVRVTLTDDNIPPSDSPIRVSGRALTWRFEPDSVHYSLQSYAAATPQICGSNGEAIFSYTGFLAGVDHIVVRHELLLLEVNVTVVWTLPTGSGTGPKVLEGPGVVIQFADSGVPNFLLIPIDECGELREDKAVSVDFSSVRELDEFGGEVKAIDFEASQLVFTSTDLGSSENQFQFAGNLFEGTANTGVLELNFQLFGEAKDLLFANLSFSVHPSSNKMTFRLYDWVFDSLLNSLEMTLKFGITQGGSVDVDGVLQFSRGSVQVTQLPFREKNVVAEIGLLPLALVDSQPQNVGRTWSADYRQVTLAFPAFADELLYDPDVSLLFGHSSSEDSCDGGGDDEVWVIVVPVVVAVVLVVCLVVVVIGVVLVITWRRKAARALSSMLEMSPNPTHEHVVSD